jgi:hypothetical protein
MLERSGALRILSALALAACAAACEPSGGGGVRAIVWQRNAQLGDSVAVPISSNALPALNFDDPSPSSGIGTNVSGLSKDNVRVALTDSVGVTYVTPDAVIEASAARPSSYASTWPGAWMAIVVFTVPSSLVLPSYPAAVSVDFYIGGVLDAFTTNTVWVTGSAGGATTFAPPLSQLENPPLLRLRAQVGTNKFSTSCQIGSIQFDLMYSSAVSNPKAFVNSEAFRGTVSLWPTGSGSARVILVAPDGFALRDSDHNGIGGMGPLIDISFTKVAPFDASHFSINNLVVTKPDGTLCLNQANQTSTQAFQLIVVGG